MLYESDEECDITNMLNDDEEEDDDDDDYVPGKRDSDSDPEYGKRKKKSSRSTSRYVPGKRNRTSSSSSNTQKNLNKSDDLNSDEITDQAEDNEACVTSNVSEHLSCEETDDKQEKNSPVKSKAIKTTHIKMKTTKLKAKSPRAKKPKKSYSDEAEETPSSLRRSGRGSRTRAVSYADADVSEEDMFEDEDLFETFRDISKEKAKVTKKRHVDDLWSKFKTDVIEKEKPDEEEVDSNKTKPILSEKICSKSPTSTPTELNCENDDRPVSETKPSGTAVVISDGSPTVEPTEKKEIETTSILKNDNLDLEEKSNIEVDNSNHCEKLDENNKKSLSPTKPIEEKELSTSLPEKHIEEASIVRDDEKSNPNGNIKGELSITKPDLLKDAKPIENIPMNAVVVVDEKEVLAGSSSSPSNNLKNISQEIKETKTQVEPFIMKTNAVRSAGISNFLSSGVKKSGGLSSVLNTIEKKKKISVLDKTKCDWDNYKSEEDIEEELRGNRHAGYLDRQEFLQRVDYKQWENEREMRLYTTRK